MFYFVRPVCVYVLLHLFHLCRILCLVFCFVLTIVSYFILCCYILYSAALSLFQRRSCMFYFIFKLLFCICSFWLVMYGVLFRLFCSILPALSLFQSRSCMFYFILFFQLVSVLSVLFYFPSLTSKVVLFCCSWYDHWLCQFSFCCWVFALFTWSTSFAIALLCQRLKSYAWCLV